PRRAVRGGVHDPALRQEWQSHPRLERVVETRALPARESRHRARKRFGQNFLVDRNYIDRIVDAIDPHPGDNLVEIGPGLGALTRPLLERVGSLTVIEIDRDLAARLAAEFDAQRVVLHSADALEFDFSMLGRDLRIVGNLPYNISSPLLF